MNPIDIALIISAILAFPFFLLVFLRNPRNPLNISFSVFTFHIMLWGFSIASFRMAKTESSALFWDQMIYYCGSIVPASVFYMSYVLVFKKRLSGVYTTILSVAALVFIGILFLYSHSWITSVTLNNYGNSVTLGPAYVVWMIYFAAVYMTGLFLLVRRYLITSGFEKTQLRFIFFASLMPILIGLVPNVLMPLVGNYKYIYLGPFANTVMVLIIAYAILKHRFMDVRLVLARSISYSLLLIILATGYMSGLIILSSYFIKINTSSANLLILTILSLIMAIIFQPLRLVLEKFTDKIFYKSHYDEREFLHTLSQTVATTPTLSNLSYKLLNVIVSEMRVSKAFFAIIRGGKLYISESLHQENKLDIEQNEVERLQSENTALVFDEIPEGRTKGLMRRNEISVIYPLRTRENYIGMLLLGEKKSGEIYFDQDIKVLEISGPEMAVALQNAQRYEEINQFNATLQEEIKVATGELRAANDKLKKLDQLKDEFISIASYDLRSPLATIKGFVWMAVSDIGDSSPKAKKHLEVALESTERGISLVNDMLDVSRIEAGRIELSAVKIDLTKMANEVQEESKVMAGSKNISISVESKNSLFAMGDADRIHQVFANLVGNAIKFTSEGGKIDISLEIKDKFIEISVKDTGIGISQDDINKLFVKFGRLGNTSLKVPVVTGTGLGLYICKNIVELSGGKIWVTSEPGKGSIFTFSLPKA